MLEDINGAYHKSATDYEKYQYRIRALAEKPCDQL